MPMINLCGVQVSVSDQRVSMPRSDLRPSTSALIIITLHVMAKACYSLKVGIGPILVYGRACLFA